MAQNLKDLAGRLPAGPRGMGTALKLLLGAGAVAYGVRESVFTGESGRPRAPPTPRTIKEDKDLVEKLHVFFASVFSTKTVGGIPTMICSFLIVEMNLSFQVSLLIRRELTERAKDFSLILDDVAITELSFSREYTAAVEAKQVAQQEAQRAQFLVEKAKQEQKQKIVQAEGEATAGKMISFPCPVALSKNPGYIKLRKIRAAQNISKTIAASQNRVYLTADNLQLNLQDEVFLAARSVEAKMGSGWVPESGGDKQVVWRAQTEERWDHGRRQLVWEMHAVGMFGC
uniref:Prohibitin n=1 Tax=Chelydra serpentina TaxID=8475 RepID=A0A8C3SZ98_CHESE